MSIYIPPSFIKKTKSQARHNDDIKSEAEADKALNELFDDIDKELDDNSQARTAFKISCVMGVILGVVVLWGGFMGKYDALVSSIVNNTGLHQVNREEKMNRTLDVMCQNIDKRHSFTGNKGLLSEAEIRGYNTGTGRKTGD